MPFGHHGKEIADILYKCVRFDGFTSYFNSRWFQTDFLKASSRKNNSTLRSDELKEDDGLGLIVASNIKPQK